MHNNKNKLRIFEMFAGYGGASFALKRAGIEFETMGYSEINKDAIEIYNLNHPGIKNFGDCTKINPKELPDFDLLTGGFPCQPFSVNTRQGVRGETHKSSNLFLDIIRILEEKQPTYVFLENVKGLLGEKSKNIFEKILEELKRTGYDIKVELVNSKDYGTPQNRERVLLIGKLGGFSEGEFIVPEKSKLTKSVFGLLEQHVERREPKIKKMKLAKKINLELHGNISRFDAILNSPVSKKNSNIAFEILDAPSNVVSRQCDRIFHPTYSPCLTATGTDYLFYVNNKVIVLTPRECFRIMGFFNDEINLGNIKYTALHKLAGNGWDINIMSKFLSKLINTGGIKVEEETIQNEIKEIINSSIKDNYKLILIREVINGIKTN